ncbi:hypothetical protein IQ07DRAFT_561915 [Pyrenochaeta sp. DS3sAY3a]|nr:hypothetical protein IQ07DRAFT_561915 [Pyrenochaeta sp. DS3sAY3a]
MSLAADFSTLQPAFTTFARASTFPKSAVVVARQRVQQFTGHLARSNTMANMLSKKDAHDAQPSREPTARQAPAGTDVDSPVEDVENQLPPFPNPLPTPHKDFRHCLPLKRPEFRKFSVFTAGSIEMGKAVQWQKLMAVRLSHLPITVNNPRRGHWDNSLSKDAAAEELKKQIAWELYALEQADVICFFFDVTTISPVTLLELGLWAASGKIVVCCAPKYHRSGNVKITCEHYGVPFVTTFDELPGAVEKMLKDKGMALDANGDLIGPNTWKEKKVEKVVFKTV